MNNEINGIGGGLTRASVFGAIREAANTTRSDAFSAIMAEKLTRQDEDILSAAVSAAQQASAANTPIYTAPAVSAYTDQAQSLLGKTVTAYALVGQPDGTVIPQTVTGVVQAVYLDNGQTYLSVNGYQISPANVISASETQASAYPSAYAQSAYTQTAYGAEAYASDSSLIGSLVSYPSYDSNGNMSYAQGFVTEEFRMNGIDYITVNGLDIELSAVNSVQSGTGTTQTTATSNIVPYGVVYTPPVYNDQSIYLEQVEQVATQAVNMSQDLKWLLSLIENDPALLTDGEFDVFGEPDEFGAYG